MRLIKIFCFILCLQSYCSAQKIEILTSGTKASLRGLSVVSNQVFWASGSTGKVARSTNGGASIQWITVPGFEKRDFRDIKAYDSNTAIIMAIAEPAIILKTKDGGKNWAIVFEDSTKGMFLDAMDFRGRKGVVIGDPINNKLFRAYTNDAGDHWAIDTQTPTLAKGEAFFAASGTNINAQSGYYVSGGLQSSLYLKDQPILLPLKQGKESTGANSIALFKKKAVITGGDFSSDKDSSGNCILVDLSGKPVFTRPQTAPHGYRSCVIYLDQQHLISCGTSGVDISKDGGKNWELISTESFHVVQKAEKGSKIYLAGGGGRIASLQL